MLEWLRVYLTADASRRGSAPGRRSLARPEQHSKNHLLVLTMMSSFEGPKGSFTENVRQAGRCCQDPFSFKNFLFGDERAGPSPRPLRRYRREEVRFVTPAAVLEELPLLFDVVLFGDKAGGGRCCQPPAVQCSPPKMAGRRPVNRPLRQGSNRGRVAPQGLEVLRAARRSSTGLPPELIPQDEVEGHPPSGLNSACPP